MSRAAPSGKRCRRWHLPVALVAVLALAAPGLSSASEAPQAVAADEVGHLTIVAMTTDGSVEPLGVDATRPGLAWVLGSAARGQRQSAYQVVVEADGEIVWDSGKLASAESAGVPYRGPPLRSETRYDWRVRVWDAADRPSPWSASASWEMGLLQPSDWDGARWIGSPLAPVSELYTGLPGPQTAAPLLRRDLSISKEVQRARVYVSGVGYYLLSIDGERVGDSVLDPGPTVYNETTLYATHDVTSAVQEQGPHALGVTLGRGFYGLPPGDTAYWGGAPWRGDPRLLLKLQIDYTDGTSETVVSDDTWQYAPGPTTRDSIYLGESYDARLEQPGWDRPDFGMKSAWIPASVRTAPTSNLRSQRLEPIRVLETMRAEEITSPRDGTYVFRFPVVTAGWARLQVQGTAGTEVTLRYGETLRADGTVNNDGDRGLTNAPIQTDVYVLRGTGGVETWEPSFSYKGFQYIQVDGYPGTPTADDVVAQVLHNDVPSTGDFASSEALLNTIHDMTRRTILNNLHSVFTDTPMFEKRGWLGDAAVLIPTTIDNFGMRLFYRNWLYSIVDNQRADGAGVDLSPNPHPAGYTDPIWAGALVEIPWEVYREYGDRDVLAANYDAMARYVDYLSREADGFIQRGFYGDWSTPASEDRTTGPKPIETYFPPEGAQLTATAYFYRYAVATAEAAQVLRRSDDAARFAALAEQIKTAFNARFLDADNGVYRTDKDVGYRQTSNAVPLMFGLVPPGLVDTVAQNLADDVAARGNHLTTGHAGTKELLPALTENGHVDAAFAVATQRTFPSWGHWIEQGATTLWESWETNSRSRDHAFLGSIDDWFYRDLAGITPAAPGYARIAIRPYLPTGLDHAAASMDTVRGTVSSAWDKAPDGSVTFDVTIPVNATAELALPATSAGAVTERSVPAAEADGVRFLRVDGDRAVFEVGSGSYSFVVAAPASGG